MPKSQHPYRRHYIADARIASMMLNLEQDGFYRRLQDAQWHAQSPVPERDLPRRLMIDPRTARRLSDELERALPCRIVRAGGMIWCRTVQREIDRYNRRLLATLAARSENPKPPQLPFLVHAGGRPPDRGSLGAALGKLAASVAQRQRTG